MSEATMSTMGLRPPRVAVVDDERHIRELLEIGLGDEGFEVRSAADGQAGLSLVREWSPDIIVLDVMLPKIDGIALLPLFRRLTEAPILMLSAKGEVDDKIAGLTGGADDYVSKPFEMSELIARLETALRRPKLAKPRTVRYADLAIDLETRTVERGERSVELSAREFDLLVTLARHPHRVFTRDQLLDLVWGSHRDVGQGAVETYISYLRTKIDQGFPKRLIQTHRGAGYSLRER
ncbi:MAG: response regulator transcription factor [Candidatus Eremiobacteraeota bacterium]|nr:response regulator transcription factor [Candidatus Eremiobacteraeota bacterium]MBV9647269.1 response regulator transcription factor [Candidatus Eremiobacteraeota bacterium]